MRARALTFSFLTSLSVLRQEHRFPNTLFLCSRTFLCPRTTSSSYSPVSLSLALSPSQNLTISLRFRAPVTVVQTFTFLWEAGSPPRIGFARFALMFHRNELYKRQHTRQSVVYIWRYESNLTNDPVVHTYKRQATTIAKRVTKRCRARRFLRHNSMKDRRIPNPKDGRSFEKWTEGSHCKPSTSPFPPRKAIANRTSRREKNCRYSQTSRPPLPPRFSTNLYRDEANKRVDEYCANHLEDSSLPSSLLSLFLSLSLSRISYDQESFSIRIDNQFGWSSGKGFRFAKVFHTAKVSPVATILTQNPLVRLTNRFFPRRSLDNYPC